MQIVHQPLCSEIKSTGKLRNLILFCSLLSLFSCGGGGGGGSSDSGNSKSAPTGIRIINAALDYPAMQVNSAEAGILSSAKFAEVAYHGAVNSGAVNLVVSTTANPLAGLWSGGTELRKNEHKSILVYRGFADKDLAFSLLNDAGIEIPEGQAAVRVINAVVNSSPLSLSAIGFAPAGVASIGASSEYSFIPAGSYNFVISSGASVVGRVSAALESRTAYSVVSYGAAGYFVTSNILQD